MLTRRAAGMRRSRMRAHRGLQLHATALAIGAALSLSLGTSVRVPGSGGSPSRPPAGCSPPPPAPATPQCCGSFDSLRGMPAAVGPAVVRGCCRVAPGPGRAQQPAEVPAAAPQAALLLAAAGQVPGERVGVRWRTVVFVDASTFWRRRRDCLVDMSRLCHRRRFFG